ncbi:hypothetical protein HYQ46_004468 [Verticillium longisporum]|nr:hypothetical protein HYQ46_004468 [Verticillium longisporum]
MSGGSKWKQTRCILFRGSLQLRVSWSALQAQKFIFRSLTREDPPTSNQKQKGVGYAAVDHALVEQDSQIFLVLVVEDQTLLDRQVAVIGFALFHGRFSDFRVMDEAALALLAACTTGGIILAVLADICLLRWRRRRRKMLRAGRQNFGLVVT